MSNVVSVREARQILGDDAVSLSDEDIQEVIDTLDLLAKDALDEAKIAVSRKKDAKDMANLIYDIYQDKKRSMQKLQ